MFPWATIPYAELYTRINVYACFMPESSCQRKPFAFAFDMQGRLLGVTEYPRLYFVGLPWLHNAKSGLLFGVGEDGAYIGWGY